MATDKAKREELLEARAALKEQSIGDVYQKYFAFANLAQKGALEESTKAHEGFEEEVQQFEFSLSANTPKVKALETDRQFFADLRTDLENKLPETKRKLEEAKEELGRAKKHRKNLEEYDALSASVLQHKSQEQSVARIEKLKRKIERLKQRRVRKRVNAHTRSKQLALLLTIIDQLSVVDQSQSQLPRVGWGHDRTAVDF